MWRKLSDRTASILAFSFFGAWLLSFAYEGQILYALFHAYQTDPGLLLSGAVLAHAAGLFGCGFMIKDIKTAKKLMLASAGLCILGCVPFFFAPSALWAAALLLSAFFAGIWNGAWGYFYRSCSLPNERMGTVSASLAGSTTLMIGLNMAAIHLLPEAGLGLAVLSLFASLYFTARLPEHAPEASRLSPAPRTTIRGPLALLCLFILVITINSGLMFQVVNPAFAHLTTLTSWYWAVPYVLALVVVARLPGKINRSYLLYAAIAMLGFGFIAFLLLSHSAGGYLAVNTLLLGAFGILDLFWWSMLGELLDFHQNPAKVLGIGLSVNVAGVLLGEVISGFLSGADGDAPTLVGLAVVCVALMILPPLHRQLTLLLKNSSFFTAMVAMPPEKQRHTITDMLRNSELTPRENQIVSLLLQGYTYRLVARELYISESTVKTHIQNIYYKLDVRNKSELIQKLIK